MKPSKRTRRVSSTGTCNYGDMATEGGIRKPLQYFYEASLYRDVIATCGVGGVCYAKNDGMRSTKVVVTVSSQSPLCQLASGLSLQRSECKRIT